MPRMTVIGNSHIGALKLGWESLSAHAPDWSLRFFGLAGADFRYLTLTDEKAFGLPANHKAPPEVAATVVKINGALTIDLAGQDVILRAGPVKLMVNLVAGIADRDVEGLLETGGPAVMSRAEFDTLCLATFNTYRPDRKWLAGGLPHQIVMAIPLPSEEIARSQAPEDEVWSRFARRPGDKRPLIAAIFRAYERDLAQHNIALVTQRAETLATCGLTKAEHARNSRRLSGSLHTDVDYAHMNAGYGALVLQDAIARGAALLQGPPPAAGATAQQNRLASGQHPPAASPYTGLTERAFWRSAVAARAPLDPGDLYVPRFTISRQNKIATAGSCFAQHIGRALRGAAFNVLDCEPAPTELDTDEADARGYGLFSARYGNIYTARQLLQVLREAEGQARPAAAVWERNGRFYDAQRPGILPGGLPSEAAVLADRASHLAALRGLFRDLDVFVFTFGLTEAWVHQATGTVYPTAPGTIAGQHDPSVFAFRNFDATEVLADFEAFRAALLQINPGVRFLVTVSPVPLTATATDMHVEVATAYSKATLRAVCGMLVARHPDIDYFPSYELITSQNARGVYFDANMRNVSNQGVAAAMKLFMTAQGIGAAPQRTGPVPGDAAGADQATTQCEDALLEAFATPLSTSDQAGGR
ncbi:MAG: GSCFA domain-containing protein [Paracoccaceae bacterium]